MENKTYLSQFRTDTGTGRKRMWKLKAALANAGVFCYDEPGNTTSHRAVYVNTHDIGIASKVWGRVQAEINAQFAPKL